MPETPVATAPSELDQGWLADFAERWERAWNSHRPERLLELMTEDVVYDDSSWPTTMRGHSDVRAFLDSVWRAFPDLSFEMTDGPFVMAGAQKAAFWWHGAGTFSGPLEPPGFAPTGDRIEFEGADFLEYRDGRVRRLRIVFDMMDVARQLGTMPKPGTRMEQAAAALQRLGARVRSRRRG